MDCEICRATDRIKDLQDQVEYLRQQNIALVQTLYSYGEACKASFELHISNTLKKQKGEEK